MHRFSFLNVQKAGFEVLHSSKACEGELEVTEIPNLPRGLHPPVWVNGREHKNCQNSIQALRREGKAGRLLTDVMDEGMADTLVVLWIGLGRKKIITHNETLSTLHSVSYKKHSYVKTESEVFG